jgi:glutathione synthase/RimK-type ligase-like ATP-grasp enzyme
MRIAIHHVPGSFSDEWIAYCKKEGIAYKLVNCYAQDIVEQVSDCDAFMWHHHHRDYRDVLFAKQLLYALEHSKKRTFPDYRTCWHFDDKVGQKYLLEAIGAPLVPSYVFYSRPDALKWIENVHFPKVFKLRSGAGSQSVRLVHSRREARKLIVRAFTRGFSHFDGLGDLRERIRHYREGKITMQVVAKGLARFLIPPEFARMHTNETGYVYFQDFIPGNSFDIRVIVIAGKAFAIKRMVRKNDFRASGSGNILYGKEHFSPGTIRLAFQIADRLESQCAALDFIYDSEGNPLVTEVSYGFISAAYRPCVGYWDKSFTFHEGPFKPEDWMVEMMIDPQRP